MHTHQNCQPGYKANPATQDGVAGLKSRPPCTVAWGAGTGTRWQRPSGSYRITALCVRASAGLRDTLNPQYTFSPVPIQLDAPA